MGAPAAASIEVTGRAIQVTNHWRTSSLGAYDRQTGRLGRKHPAVTVHYAWARSRMARDQCRTWAGDGRQARAAGGGGGHQQT